MDDASETLSARGVYGITVAAELVGVGEQTLRLYERKGLLEPSRTPGGTRRYSEDDLSTLRRVIELLDAGVNLVGARHVLALEAANRLLRAQLDEAEERADDDSQRAETVE
ncbi:MerR family transcriptional regulator [Microbacterium sp. KHB019]|uniref:MerR family transcriptional regulator n=1 Tax=Microbacterium sp. KHB019 TaxID=3129770 RepID=UPI0030796E64